MIIEKSLQDAPASADSEDEAEALGYSDLASAGEECRRLSRVLPVFAGGLRV